MCCILRVFSVVTALTVAIIFSTGSAIAGEASFEAEFPLPSTDRSETAEYELSVNMGIYLFTVDAVSIAPWICEAQIHNVYADGIALPNYANEYYVETNPNVQTLTIRTFVPENKGYCKIQVRGYVY